MKKYHCILSFILTLFSISCVTTPGIYDETNKKPLPMKFCFIGSQQEMIKYIKTILVLNSFEISTDDPDSGILTTRDKPLETDETFDTTVGTFLAGAQYKQTGRVSFFYTETEKDRFEISVLLKWFVQVTIPGNVFSDTQPKEKTCFQGYPLPQKIKRILLENQFFTYIE